ncbi:MAG: phenylacetate--CoA ligase family protein [Ruminiclostridium sp.]|nr:phenylacetate--CoA ligase family protein [Ruminiclostridium sp.]
MNYLKLLWDLYRLKRNTSKTPAQIQRLREKKLRKMISFAYDHSDYYRRSFKQAGINEKNIMTAPLSAFPTIDKQQLLKHFDELVTAPDLKQEELRRFDESTEADRSSFKGKYHLVHSSGSTGIPGYFVYDNNAWNSMLLGIIRAALWNMSMGEILKLLKQTPRILYIAATDGRYGGAMAVGDGIDGVRAKQLYLDINTPLARWIDKIREFKPNMIIGYPSALKILGELAERGEAEVNVFRIITCGEPLGVSLRSYLEKTFNAEVINFYGASESLALGVETDPKEGMILFDDMNVIEVENGNMYLTSLYNFAQPLIRYRLTDSLTLEKPDANSPYPFTRATGLLGRSDDILWFADERGNREFLHPLAVEGLCIEGLRDYQFRRTSHNSFEMLAEVSKTASETEVRAKINKQVNGILSEKGLSYVRCKLTFVKEIRPDKHTGKKRLIIGSGKSEERSEIA